jgi:hypothetical protein
MAYGAIMENLDFGKMRHASLWMETAIRKGQPRESHITAIRRGE